MNREKLMRRAIVMLFAACSTGCAYNVERAANVTGNEVSVTVNNVWNANQAFPIADKHCHRYGKAARATISKEYAYTFDCVTP